MKPKIFLLVLFFLIFTNAYNQEVKYTHCDNCWSADSLGNHRASIQFIGEGNVCKVVIPWRRRDHNPQDKRIIVVDAQSGRKVMNVKTGLINRETGEIYFEAVSGKGRYYVYYMPYKNEGRSNYPKGTYLKSEITASTTWLNSFDASLVKPNATVEEIQSVNTFNSFFPMEVIATKKETESLKAAHSGKAFIVFPEDRDHSIRMKDDLPQRWIQKGIQSSFVGESAKGEYFVYQLGVYALQQVEDVQVRFSALTSSDGKIIPAKNITCINTTGTTYDSKPFIKKIDIAQDEVQPLWCGIDVPENAMENTYSGKVTVTAKGTTPQVIDFSLIVSKQIKKDGGVNEPWNMTRLKWLNSTLAQKNEVIAPYTPLEVSGNSISLLGRKLVLNKDGFPRQIQTFFTPAMTDYAKEPENILVQPMQWWAEDNKGTKISWKSSGPAFTTKDPGIVKWESSNLSDAVSLHVSGSLEFDGFLSYEVKLTALKDISFNNTIFQIPFNKSFAKYMMGLGQKGGKRLSSFDWKWDVANKNQDGAWIGDVHGGLQYSLRDEKYVRPLNTNFYLQKPLLLPSSWGNDGKGGIQIREKGNTVFVNNYSGQLSMKKGDVLYYNFTLLITPFHTLDTDFQWATRFYHSYKDIDTVKASGATVINIHHANAINPWINYPFIEHAKMKAYIDEAHSQGLKVKIYNTVRELSNHAYETFALRSLGTEIYSPGKGGGYSWLQEHLDSNYIAAWFVPQIKDAAIVNSGMSRWHNYYVEGMNWLVKNVGIDGIYLDDVAFDRITMKRIKRVLTNDEFPGIIDLHSANQFNKSDGFNNSANLYMEHFPYLNRLWFGEYFDYENNSPEFFLTEISGIAFGLMGEMLQDGGNPWRGMLYGMTNRMPWSDNADPRPLWKLWDDFGMEGTKMIGYWVADNPVKTNNEKVLVTVYQKNGKSLVSIASWAETDVDVELIIDWKKLGLDPAKASLKAPEIKNIQKANTFSTNQKIRVEKGKGWMLVLEN